MVSVGKKKIVSEESRESSVKPPQETDSDNVESDKAKSENVQLEEKTKVVTELKMILYYFYFIQEPEKPVEEPLDTSASSTEELTLDLSMEVTEADKEREILEDKEIEQDNSPFIMLIWW